MPVTHHIRVYDHGRETGRLEAYQSVTTIGTAMGGSKSAKSQKVEIIFENMLVIMD